jgi:hypothetical protein
MPTSSRPTSNTFSARPAALGYLYQVRFALLLLMSRGYPDGRITIEKFDDVAFDTDGTPTELLQLKHRIASTGSLTDASSDLWKTIRIWAEEVRVGGVAAEQTLFSLVTTGRAAAHSAAWYLHPTDHRSAVTAYDILGRVAIASSNASNAAGYEAFLRLPEDARKRLVSSIHVLDSSPTIEDVRPLIERELALTVRQEHITSVFTRVEGWWFGEVVRHLTNGSAPALEYRSLQAYVSDVRDMFTPDSLPIDFFYEEPPEGADSEDRRFVVQLRLIASHNNNISFAIRDYYRAFKQRSAWLREDLLQAGELQRYEDRLVEEWQRFFAFAQEGIAPNASEEDLQRAGRELFQTMHNRELHIRSNTREPYVMRGSLHILADRSPPLVGWHPEFLARLQALVAVAAGADD